MHPTYAFPAAAGSAGNYAPGKLVWSSKDKHTVPVDAALTGHTTVVDHHPEANHPQRHEVFVEPSRVAFTTEGTQFKTQSAILMQFKCKVQSAKLEYKVQSAKCKMQNAKWIWKYSKNL